MKIIGNRKYPSTVEGVLAKKELAKFLRAQLKTDYNLNHLDFLLAPYDPMTLYQTYIHPSAKDQINLSAGDLRDAIALQDKWDDPSWPGVIKELRKSISELIDRDTLHRMYTSPAFKAYHAAHGGREPNVMDETSDDEPDRLPPKVVRAAQRLGISDADKLRIYIGHLEKFGAEKARDYGQKLLRKEGVRIKLKTVNEFLFHAGFATKSNAVQPETLGAVAPQVKLNKKKLQICGFQNLLSDKALGRIRGLVLALSRKDKRGAEMVFAKILKEEPKTSLLHGAKLTDLIKQMKKVKAFEIL